MNDARLKARSGFSLVELMIVLVIVSVLFGISLGVLREENMDAAVQAEAERLAAVLRQTRNRSVAEGKSYAVAFNITNAQGTTGAALNNWDGGHWYRVIGPDGGKHDNASGIPLAGRSDSGRSNENFPDFVENVKDSWVDGEQYFLPTKRVRFLALSDTDEGPRRNYGTTQSDTSYRHYTYRNAGSNDETTYPRPWFGYYDEATKTLWPWGGYDPSKDVSGFFYEGADGDITGNIHPSDRSFNHDFNLDKVFTNQDFNNDGDSDDFQEQENPYYIWRQDEPRALIEANWLDACIMFTTSGEARFLEWCRGRRGYENDGSKNHHGSGIHDRAKQRYENPTYNSSQNPDWFYTAPELPIRYAVEDNGGVAHFNRHTGGFHITLAPDMLVDSNQFGSVEEAIDSIDPAWRVFVAEFGAIRVFRVQRRVSDNFLTSQTYLDDLSPGGSAWPATANAWTADPTLIWQECRVGWLHEVETTGYEDTLVPTGAPIVDVLNGKMMTDRIWWVK